MGFQEYTENQGKHLIDSLQLFEGYEETEQKLRSYQGHMQWKKIGGKQYLYRIIDTAGNGKSLGRRSSETERIKESFDRGKKEWKERYKNLKERLETQARFNRAGRLNRLPKTASLLLQALQKHNVLQKLTVIGTYDLYAYEVMAGGQIAGDLTATQDIDILWDKNSKIKLSSNTSIKSLLEILRKADPSFQKKGSFSAMNMDGFLVDFIRQEANPPWKRLSDKEKSPFGNVEDIQPVGIASLEWLVSSPKISQVVIGHNGFPVRIQVPDPRAFCIHKIWLSEQSNREPIKRKRDRKQAELVAMLIREYLPQYRFEADDLRMFPKEINRDALAIFNFDEEKS